MRTHGSITMWDPEPEPSWRGGCGLLVMSFLLGMLLGWIIFNATAPKPAAATTPRPSAPEVTALTVSPAPAASAQPSTSPLPTPAQSLASRRPSVRLVNGVASHMGAAAGPGYLALPEGPGKRVAITGRGGCVERRSTDAGPDLAMQRAGRVVDLYVGDFEKVCGVPASAGLCHVTVAYGGSCA